MPKESIKQLGIRQTRKICNLMEVHDGEGKVKCNDEAVDVWCNQFSRLLGGADESSCGGGGIGTKESALTHAHTPRKPHTQVDVSTLQKHTQVSTNAYSKQGPSSIHKN